MRSRLMIWARLAWKKGSPDRRSQALARVGRPWQGSLAGVGDGHHALLLGLDEQHPGRGNEADAPALFHGQPGQELVRPACPEEARSPRTAISAWCERGRFVQEPARPLQALGQALGGRRA